MSTKLSYVSQCAKAVVGAVMPALVVLGAALQASSPGGSTITGGEWLQAAVAFVTTGGVVWAVPNAKKPALVPVAPAVTTKQPPPPAAPPSA